MLTAKNITYKIGDKLLLNDVSATFLPGKLNLIIGPNGAGKSTFIKVICSQLKPQMGTVLYGTKEISRMPFAELARVRSVLSQHVDLVFPLSVRDVVMMGRYPHFSGKPTAKDETACDEAMKFFNVQEMAERNYMTLSGGEKQRVHFARVAVQIWHPVQDSCRYLVLDEPLTFLDVHYQFQFMRQIIDLLKSSDLVVVGVVHDLNLAAKFADHILLLDNAKVVASGNREEVLTKENIKAAYRLEPVIHKNDKSMYLFFE